MAVVDCLDIIFHVKVEEGFWGFSCSLFCELAKSPHVKGLLVSGCSLEIFNVFTLFLLARGGDGLHFCVPVAVMDLSNQSAITGFAKNLHKEFLRKGSVPEEIIQEHSNLLVHHLNERSASLQVGMIARPSLSSSV
jgi:hypothetical protein